MAEQCCGVCGEMVAVDAIQEAGLDPDGMDFRRKLRSIVCGWELSNMPNYKPPKPHLLDRIPLAPDGVLHNGAILRVCNNCCRAVNKYNAMPPFALANGLQLDEILEELQDLTIPEQMLISRLRIKCCIALKVGVGGKNTPKTHAIKGHCIAFPAVSQLFLLNLTLSIQDTSSLYQVLPMAATDLAGLFQVVFIGDKMPGAPGVKWNFKVFNVRKWRILAALLWLIEHNPLYEGVKIDFKELNKYPEDDVPDEIMKGAVLMKRA